jgi:Domain of unknown function (DUF4157)
MSDRLNATAKKRQNLDSTFNVNPFQPCGFVLQARSEESTLATNAQLWESYQQAKQLNQNGANSYSVPIQAKLTIGQLGDKYEQEADSGADRVMAMSAPAQVQREELPEEEEELQMKQSSESNTPASTPDLENRLSSSKGGGSPLSDDVRSFMEPRFGADFSGVRVHTGSDAVQMNRDVNAQAFAHGSDIYFGAGKAPRKDVLTAHELTHVVQQVTALHRIPLQRKAVTDLAKRALQSGKSNEIHQILWRLINSHGLSTNSELSGTEYNNKKKGITIKLKDDAARTQGVLIAGDDVLQRLANGQVAQIVQEIAAQIGRIGKTRGTIDYVFIMGEDKKGTKNPFYAEAKKFFEAEYSSAVMIEDVRDLDGINQRINNLKKPVANLYIVSHANADGTVQFSLNPQDKSPGQMQYDELKKANASNALTKPQANLIGFWTNIVIRGCNLGRSDLMLDETKKAFGGSARVMAPTHEQMYGAGKESMAGPFYEELGKSKLSNDEAFAKIKAKPEYAFITKADWRAMRGTLKRIDDSMALFTGTYEFPKKGNEMKLLFKSMGLEAKKYKVKTIEVQGKNTIFHYVSKNPEDNSWQEITAETPPDDKAAIALATVDISRPNAYKYKISRTYTGDGLTLKIVVTSQRTEWVLYHSQIKKQRKGFNPSQGKAPWYGDTN